MPKTNILKIGMAVLLIVFCLHLNGRSIAGDCDDLEHSKGTSIVTGDHSYPAGWLSTADSDIEYDTENSAETVDRNDSATISVIGNNAPFTWSVSGTGFTLDNAQTTGLTNTLNADGTACGSATITVTDACSSSVTGYVRCTTGQWVYDSDGYVLINEGGVGPGNCATVCPDNAGYCGNWGVYAASYFYADPKHRLARQIPSGGTHYTNGCFDLTVYIATWTDGTTFQILQATPFSSCSVGCLEFTYELRTWECGMCQ